MTGFFKVGKSGRNDNMRLLFGSKRCLTMAAGKDGNSAFVVTTQYFYCNF